MSLFFKILFTQKDLILILSMERILKYRNPERTRHAFRFTISRSGYMLIVKFWLANCIYFKNIVILVP